MEVLGDLSILAYHKPEDITKPLQALLQGADVPGRCVVILAVDSSGFVFVRIRNEFGSLVHSFLLGFVPGQTSANNL